MADPALTAFASGADPRLLRPEDQHRYQRQFESQAVRSYLYLSLGIGLIAVLLPILLVIAGGYQAHDSISSFYHQQTGPARDIMVGCLCAVGVFLFLFHGLSTLENWLLNAAGAAAIAIALVPSPGDTGYGSTWVHRGAAILFFLLLAIVAVFLSKGRIKGIVDERKKRWFAAAYTVAGAAMAAMPVIVAALQFVPGGLFKSHWVFWTECAGIWSFSAYWFLKTFEYRLLLRIRWTG
jgi:hypothetical protein